MNLQLYYPFFEAKKFASTHVSHSLICPFCAGVEEASGDVTDDDQ